MGAVKEMLIEQAEWLEEKLNSVKDENTPEYTFEMCQDLICKTAEWFGVDRCRALYKDIWKVAQLSPEDGNKLMDISEDLYVLAMEEHCECADSIMRSDTPLSDIKDRIMEAKEKNE